MDKKTGGIIATVVAVLLCGCPGLFSLCFGLIAAMASFVPGAAIDVYGSNDPQSAMLMGFGAVCIGILFIAIPVVVGFLTLRKKPEQTVTTIDEPLPPAS
jgi:hypothetical protein